MRRARPLFVEAAEALLLQNSQVKMQSELTAETLNIPVSAEILLLGMSRDTSADVCWSWLIIKAKCTEHLLGARHCASCW